MSPGIAAAIQVQDLVKSYGALFALRGVSFEVSAGQCVSIFGPNGAGKSTLLRILAAISRPTAGKVWLNGMEIREQREAAHRELGMIAHQTFLYDNLTAAENLIFYARLYDVAEPAARAHAALSEVGLTRRADDLVRGFSRGMQQRLAIARAMIHSPSILLLDEPYTGLDQHAATMLTEWLRQLRSEQRTILLVTHDLQQGLALSDRTLVFLRGRIVWDKPSSEIYPQQFQSTYFEIVAEGEA